MSFAENRYESMQYNRCGASGVKLPAISLGCWNNFDGRAERGAMAGLLGKALIWGLRILTWRIITGRRRDRRS